MRLKLKNLFVLVVLSLIVVSLEVVSAQDENLALYGTPNVTRTLSYIGGGAETINDGNLWSYTGSRAYGDGAYSRLTATVLFANPINTTNTIKYKRYLMNGGSSEDRYCREYLYVRDIDGWHQVYYKNWDGMSFTDENTISVSGPWNNIKEIKVIIYASVGGHTSSNELKLYEIEAWGNLGGDGTYAVNKPCSSSDDTIMRLYQSNNSHGALWDSPDVSEIIGGGYCSGTPVISDCEEQLCEYLGCAWNRFWGGNRCVGTCGYDDACRALPGCSWFRTFLGNRKCLGTPSYTSDCYLNETLCNSVPGCDWILGSTTEYINYYDVCYNEIFGSAYSGANPHDCAGSGAVPDNKVLGLFEENNSHAEISSLSNFPFDVCYGNLECVSDNSAGDDCVDATRKVVVRLFQDTNSHISNTSDTTYLIKICCRSVISPPAAGNVYWANMLDIKINETDLNDLVKLVVEESDISGKNVEYEIYKSVKWWFDSEVATSSEGFTTWRAGMKDDGTLEAGQYYFKARIEGGVWISTEDNADANYRYLTVSATENNSPPSAIIISPVMDDKYKVDTGVTFEQITEDEDDDLIVEWDLGDGTTKTCTKSQEDCDTTHSYAKWGTKVISLTAKEVGRWQEASDVTRIFIYDEGINVFPIISEPPFGYVFGATSRLIQFNASQSYVADCTTNACPSCTYTVEDLNCYDLSKSDIPSKYNLWFNWTFSDGSEKYGNWTDNYYGVVEFSKPFYNPEKHWANLKVGYELV